MLSGPRQKFCEGIVTGKTVTDAYAEAYPKASRPAACAHGARLMAKPEIRAELGRLRSLAEQQAGGAVLTLMEKRIFLARIVRACIAKLPEDSDLWASIKRTEAGVEFRLPCKLAAIREDNDLAGEGSEAEVQDAISEMLARCMA